MPASQRMSRFALAREWIPVGERGTMEVSSLDLEKRDRNRYRKTEIPQDNAEEGRVMDCTGEEQKRDTQPFDVLFQHPRPSPPCRKKSNDHDNAAPVESGAIDRLDSA